MSFYFQNSIHRYTLTNKEMKVNIMNYGGIITNVYAPDRNGKLDDIALGFDNFEGMLKCRFNM